MFSYIKVKQLNLFLKLTARDQIIRHNKEIKREKISKEPFWENIILFNFLLALPT